MCIRVYALCTCVYRICSFIEQRPGLNGGDRTISFESIDYPGYFIRHMESELFLESSVNPRNNDTFNADATFRIHVNRFFRVRLSRNCMAVHTDTCG